MTLFHFFLDVKIINVYLFIKFIKNCLEFLLKRNLELELIGSANGLLPLIFDAFTNPVLFIVLLDSCALTVAASASSSAAFARIWWSSLSFSAAFAVVSGCLWCVSGFFYCLLLC